MKTAATWLLVIGGLIACFTAHAEVIDLEGTVKAVDVDARTVTIERKTPSGTKTLTLEVAKKAGDVADLQPGSPISFSYDPDLEIVTKIESEAKDASIESARQACVWTLDVSDTGDVKVAIEASSVEQLLKSNEQAISRKKLPDGTWHCSYVFSSADALEAFDRVRGVSFNKQTVSARMVPPGGGTLASMNLRGRIHSPFSLSGEVLETDSNEGFGVNVIGGSGTATYHHFTLQLQSINLQRRTVDVAFFLREMDLATKKWSANETVFNQRISFAKPWENVFRLPVANQRQNAHYNVTLAAGVGPVSFSRISLAGRCSPVYGIQLDEQSGAVFTKKVFPEGVAIRAGLRDGDVITSINGKKPASIDDAMKLLADTGFDEKCVLYVERGSRKETLTMMERWDRPALPDSQTQTRAVPGLGASEESRAATTTRLARIIVQRGAKAAVHEVRWRNNTPYIVRFDNTEAKLDIRENKLSFQTSAGGLFEINLQTGIANDGAKCELKYENAD